MCSSDLRGPSDTITLYVESGNAPLAIEVPDGEGVSVGASVGAAIEGAKVGVEGGAEAATGGDGLKEEHCLGQVHLCLVEVY